MSGFLKLISINLFWGITTLFPVLITAQNYIYVPGEILVQTKDEQSLNDILAKLTTLNERASKIQKNKISIKKISTATIPVLSIKTEEKQTEKFMSELRTMPGIVHVQRNKVLKQRSTPNDPEFIKQWTFNNPTEGVDHRILNAWNITTGGVTASGDTIVVAVIDDGVSRHDDLVANIWINHNEIPGNKIDNDANGYIDDYLGWNSQAKNDNIFTEKRHGTAIAGIIGAKGNNEKGVTGINWNVKAMIIDMGNITEANALSAYEYVYVMRKLYNESGGKKGAFIVSTNSSWGIDFGKAKDSPIWCGFYDKLGEVGILNCAASINQNIDVDILGDLPTTCPSDYLIGITNMNRFNLKNNDASFGKKNIDLGAYGQRAYTTSTSNGYSEFVGTSSATPHVTGAIALAYSVPCKELVQLTKKSPDIAAKLIKHLILSTVSPNESIKNTTASGGTLNIGEFIENVNKLCDNCPPVLSEVDINTLTESKASIAISSDTAKTDVRIRAAGDISWTYFYNLNNNSDIPIPFLCKEYEYQVRTVCNGFARDSFGYSRYFQSYGCCPSVNGLTASYTGKDFDFIVKLPDLVDYSFLEFRKKDDTLWRSAKLIQNFSLPDINACELYEYRASNSCLNERTKSDTTEIRFIPSQCGNCTLGSYCTPSPANNSKEWIESIKIGDNEWNTGKGQESGYSPLLSYKIPVIKKSVKIPVNINPGYAGQNFRERFYIYIDVNQNGIFEDDELILENTERLTSLQDTMILPASSLTGITRMRVIMSFSETPSPCTWNELFGEVEDYCIQIESPNSTSSYEDGWKVSNLVTDYMSLNLGNDLQSDKIGYEIYNSSGQLIVKKEIRENYIDCGSLSKGTYMIILSSEKLRQTFRFIKI